MSAAQKTAILAQVGHFYFGAVGQFYVGANTLLRQQYPAQPTKQPFVLGVGPGQRPSVYGSQRDYPRGVDLDGAGGRRR